MSRAQAPKKPRRTQAIGRTRRELQNAVTAAEAHNAALIGALQEILPLLTGEAASYREALQQMLDQNFAGTHLITALRRYQGEAERNWQIAQQWERAKFLQDRSIAALKERVHQAEQVAAILGAHGQTLLDAIQARNAALQTFLKEHERVADLHGDTCRDPHHRGGQCVCASCEAARPIADTIPAPVPTLAARSAAA